MRPEFPFSSFHTTTRTGELHMDGFRFIPLVMPRSLLFFTLLHEWFTYVDFSHAFITTEVYNSLHRLSFTSYISPRHLGNGRGLSCLSVYGSAGVFFFWAGVLTRILYTNEDEKSHKREPDLHLTSPGDYQMDPWCELRPAVSAGSFVWQI